MNIKLLVEGGEMKPGPVLSQKLGPVGINMGEVISKINAATKELKGMKIPVELEVNPSTKTYDIKVFSPPTSALLKKEAGIEKASGTQKKIKVGNLSIEQVILVAKTKMQNLLCKDLKSAVKSIVGTCVSLGILVENKSPKEIEKEIDEGKYDSEIKGEITVTPENKKKEIKKFFDELKEAQEKMLKQEQAAKEAAEAEKQATAATTTTATPATATPAKAPEKKEEKKSK